MKKYLIVLIIFLLFSKLYLAQKKGIYDDGYKNFKWGSTQEWVHSLVDKSFYLQDSSSFLITKTDMYSNLKYEKREHQDIYQYEFSFFNNTLYKIQLYLETSGENQLVKELAESFIKDIVNSYGKSKNGSLFEDPDLYNEIYDSFWLGKKISVYTDYYENQILFNSYKRRFKMAIINNASIENINKLKKKYDEEKKVLDKNELLKKAKSFREKF